MTKEKKTWRPMAPAGRVPRPRVMKIKRRTTWPRTNMVIINDRHQKPRPGDVFVLNMKRKRWIVGRVIHDRCNAMMQNGNEFLLYFYRRRIAGPHDVSLPIAPDLIIPPQISNSLGWRRGYFKTICNRPLVTEELLSRHIFQDSSGPLGGPGAVYVDEFKRPTAGPAAGDKYIAFFGLGNYSVIDELLSSVLRLPALSQHHAHAGAPVLAKGESCVTVHVPSTDAARADVLDFELLEEGLIEAVENSRAGRWEGHGTDLRSGMMDIRFFGSRADKIIGVIAPILKRTRSVPAGCYVTVQRARGAEKRVDI